MNTQIDPLLFEEAKNKIIGRIQGLNGIGTLSEKTTHAVLKYYYAPNEAYHEQKIGSFVADVCVDGEIYEIQTRQFNLLRRKLDYFLKDHEVTVIYPISQRNYLRWIDKETGEILPPRKSSLRGNKYRIIPELYKIKMYLKNPRLHFILVFLETEEYRIMDGYGKEKKKGATKTDKIPLSILDEIRINDISDYRCFLPNQLPEIFCSAEFAKSSKINRTLATVTLNILFDLGIVQRIGRKGNSYEYSVPSD